MVNWGILGCGRIARKFAADLALVSGSKLVAAGASNSQSLNAFIKDFPVEFGHVGYDALVQNNKVDVIYIATPHSHHFQHTMLCLENKKAVLCEKAFALNAYQAGKMIEEAKKQNVFLMEAFWSKFLPQFKTVKDMIADGKIGVVKSILVNFGFKPVEPIPQRIFDPELGGGSLLDIGIYNVFVALALLGKPAEIEASITPAFTGVDEQCAILFKYKNGAIAQLFSSFASNLSTEADISGTDGRIRLTSRFYTPAAEIEFYPGKMDTKQIIDVPREDGFGYQYEARHVVECLEKGLTESPVVTHADTLLMMETLDEIRKIAGIKYSSDN